MEIDKNEYKQSVINAVEDLLKKLKDGDVMVVMETKSHFNDKYDPETFERFREISGFYTLNFDVYKENK